MTSAVRPDAEIATSTWSPAGAVRDDRSTRTPPRPAGPLRAATAAAVSAAYRELPRPENATRAGAIADPFERTVGRRIGRKQPAERGRPGIDVVEQRRDAVGHSASSNSARMPSVGAYSHAGRYVAA